MQWGQPAHLVQRGDDGIIQNVGSPEPLAAMNHPVAHEIRRGPQRGHHGSHCCAVAGGAARLDYPLHQPTAE